MSMNKVFCKDCKYFRKRSLFDEGRKYPDDCCIKAGPSVTNYVTGSIYYNECDNVNGTCKWYKPNFITKLFRVRSY